MDNLINTVELARLFTDLKITQIVSEQFKDEVKRGFYMHVAQSAQWNIRYLQKKRDSMLYDHTAISRLFEETTLGNCLLRT